MLELQHSSITEQEREALNEGSTVSVRRYLRTVFPDNPVRREISRIES